MPKALLVFLLLGIPSAIHADDIRPLRAGVWKKTVHFVLTNLDGKMIAQTNETQRTGESSECFTPEDVEDPASFFATDPAIGCDGLVIIANHGVINISGGCTFRGVPLTAVGRGNYTEERYEEAISLSATYQGHQIAAEDTVTGQYLHDCP